MVENPYQEDIPQSSTPSDRTLDLEPFEVTRAARAGARLFSLAILAYLVVWAAGFVFVFDVFGFAGAMALSLIPVLPLLVAVRLRRRWPDVRGREFAFLAALLVLTFGGVVGVVQNWYGIGMDRQHAEDVAYAELARLMLSDPAFRNVKVNLSERHHIYWVSGTVATEADLNRLRSLATQCGIFRRLDGPFADSVSLTVERSPP